MQILKGGKVLAKNPSQQPIVDALLRRPDVLVPLAHAEDFGIAHPDTRKLVDAPGRGKCVPITLTAEGIRFAAERPELLARLDLFRVREAWECPATYEEMKEHPEVRPHLIFIPEFEARRTLGPAFSAEQLENIPGQGPCVVVIPKAGVEAMLAVASRDPMKRDLVEQLRQSVKAFGPAK